MSSRRKSSTPCMVRPGSGPPEHPCPEVEQPTEEELVGEPVEDDVPKPLRSPDPGEENKGPPPQHQEEGCGAGPEGRPSSLGDPEALELSEQKREGPEGGAAEMDPEDEDEDEVEGEPGDSKTSTQKTRGYVCKYCSFSTHNLCDFKDHVDTRHPNVILNPLYRCAVCDFSTNRFDSLTDHNEAQHPGETNFKFKRVTMDHQTVLEQTIEGRGAAGQEPPAPPHTSATLQKPGGDRPLHEDPKPHQEDQVTAMVNGAMVVPEPSSLQGPHMSPLLQGPHVSPLLQGPHMSPLLQGPHVSPLLQGPHVSPLLQGPHLSPLLQGPHLSPLLQGPHVSPLLQRPPNFSSVPKIAVPLNTTRYNPSLDTNLTLMSSFNKFPYPTHAELSWLTAASKHPEEQIKVWFTAQRLKQGITWSPEEVEEARKKMFNGSIPPAHHTFTVPPVSPAPPCSAQSPQPGLRSRSSPSSGPLGPGSSPSGRVSVCSSYAVARPLAEPTECQRPIMAVAPHSGDRKDKGLMAPPPPPPPLKDRPPIPMEMKRPAATPLVTMDTKRKNLGMALMPPPPLSKGQVGAPGPPAGSRPPLVFPQTLARRYVAPPPPIIAPPYKNYRIPHPSALASQEKHLVPQDSRPPGPKRPSIIQPPRAGRHPAQHPALSSHSHKLKEQQGMELKAPSPRGDKVLTPLSEANGASRDLNLQHNGVLQANGGGSERQGALQKGPVPTQFPLLERMKGKTAEQLKVLEETFLRNSFPSHGDVDALATASRLSRQEIKSWFLERRALRDNLEQALLNSMGSKKTGGLPGGPGARRQQTPQLNGVHKPRSAGGGGGHIRSPPPPPTSQVPSPIVAPPTPPPAPLLQDDGALSRWPSPEEMSQLETRTGLPRSDLLRWFTDSRLALKTSGSELTQLFHKMGEAGPIGGQQGGRANPLLDYAPNAIQRCREGAAKSNGIDTPEANASRIAENYASSLGSQQHQELQDWFSSRLRQQSWLEMKSGGGGGGGAGGGAGEVLGSWMENGHMQHAQELSLEHPQKLEG